MSSETSPGSSGSGRPSVYLAPSDLVVSATPLVVTTILGSCVAVCLYDPRVGIGGINHFLLPYRATPGEGPLRFGNLSTLRLIEQLGALGCRVERLEAKVFGGAWIAGARPERGAHLGLQNVRMAEGLLQERGIRIVASDVDGARGRKLIYHTDDGAAWVKKL